MNVPRKVDLRRALEEIVEISEASLAATRALPVRESLIAPVADGLAKILGTAKSALGAWNLQAGKPARRT